MKNLKKFASIMLTLVMLVSMATTAFAANVTLPSEGILKDHTFVAYQVFSGREESGVLSDVQWGDDIDSAAFLAALKDNEIFKDCETAADVADVLSKNNTNSELAKWVAELAYANMSGDGITLAVDTTLDDGYYLIVDNTKDVGNGGAYNKALLQIVGNVEISLKTDAPSVEKKVKEDDKYDKDGGYGDGYNDVADYNMGEAVPFRLIGTVPNMENYDTYKYIFHDTLSPGLTLNADSIKVYSAEDKDGTGMEEITGWEKAINGQSFTVSFADLKAVVGTSGYKYIIVEYTATLNQAAVVGLDGNPNQVHLEYSNKPDESGVGDTNNTGNTPVDKVIVFTYELDTTKIDGAAKEDGNHETLQGAVFKLQNAAGKWAIIDGANKITGWAETEEGGSSLISGADGLFKVIGLDDGTYYLKEIKAPTGYNLITEPIEVVITAATVNDQNWTNGVPSAALTGLSVTADNKAGTGDVDTGIAAITVANNKGATLPETGGMGTTIFYALGAVLMLGAGVLLVTKKRMGE